MTRDFYVIEPVARLVHEYAETFREAGVELLSGPGQEHHVVDRDGWFEVLYYRSCSFEEAVNYAVLYRAAIDPEVRAEMLTIVSLGGKLRAVLDHLDAVGPMRRSPPP